MINVCFRCGAYRADKIVDPQGPVAICPECGFGHHFLRLPLLVVSGASGAGKSTVCNMLVGCMKNVVVLDADILWRAELRPMSNRMKRLNKCGAGLAKLSSMRMFLSLYPDVRRA